MRGNVIDLQDLGLTGLYTETLPLNPSPSVLILILHAIPVPGSFGMGTLGSQPIESQM